MNGDSKYKMFRNFMVNELQISREDIVQWVNEAIEHQVEKMIASGELNINDMAWRIVNKNVLGILEQNSWNDKSVKQRIAENIAGKITIGVKE